MMGCTKSRSCWRALGVVAVMVFGLVAGTVVSYTSASADGWDFVYGDPGPANYSRYQDVALAPDGSTYMTGFYSGTFNGLTSTDAYRYFLQRVGSSGAVAWTKEINTTALPTQSIPYTPDLIVDGLGNPFVGVLDAWFAYDSAGAVVNSMSVPCCWGYPQRTPPLTPVVDGGFVAIVSASAPKLQHRGPDLGLLWEIDLSALMDAPSACAFCGGVVPDVTAVSDGTFWVVGRKNRALVTQQDALSMVHVSAHGLQIVAVKHFGIIPSTSLSPGVGSIVASSDSFIWVAVNAGTLFKVVSFAPADGHVLGDVNAVLPADDISTPGGIVNFGGLDFSRVNDPTAITPSEGVDQRRVLINGARLVVVARCGFVNSQPCGSQAALHPANATVMLSYSIRGPLGGGLSLLASRVLSSTASVYGMDADSTGNAVAVGSTTNGVVYAGGIETVRARAVEAGSNEQAVATRNPVGNLNTVVEFKAVAPVRVFDTRPGEPDGVVTVVKQKYSDANVVKVKVAGKLGIPVNGAGAVSLNVTVVDPAGAGFVTVYPCGERPLVSSLNFIAGQTVANAVLAPLSASGEVCFYSNSATHLLADVNGWFRAGLGFSAVSPSRVFDTRLDQPQGNVAVVQRKYGGATELRVRVTGAGGVPLANVGAVSLNVTAIDPVGAGYVTVYPCGERPLASNLNFNAGQTVPNAVMTSVSASGEICLYSNVDTNLLADVNGWFASGSSFHALSPVRLMDTRPDSAQGAVPVTKQKYGPTAVLRIMVAGVGGVPSAGVTAVSLNVTVVDPVGAGYVTVFPCGVQPLASNVNYTAGRTVPNSVIAPVSGAGEVCFYSNVDAHLLADVNGWISS